MLLKGNIITGLFKKYIGNLRSGEIDVDALGSGLMLDEGGRIMAVPSIPNYSPDKLPYFTTAFDITSNQSIFCKLFGDVIYCVSMTQAGYAAVIKFNIIANTWSVVNDTLFACSGIKICEKSGDKLFIFCNEDTNFIIIDTANSDAVTYSATTARNIMFGVAGESTGAGAIYCFGYSGSDGICTWYEIATDTWYNGATLTGVPFYGSGLIYYGMSSILIFRPDTTSDDYNTYLYAVANDEYVLWYPPAIQQLTQFKNDRFCYFEYNGLGYIYMELNSVGTLFQIGWNTADLPVLKATFLNNGKTNAVLYGTKLYIISMSGWRNTTFCGLPNITVDISVLLT